MSNASEYLAKMKVNQALALEACEKTINATVLSMYKKIIDRTPVGNPALWHPPYWPKDYTPGKLKASWSISFNNSQRDTSGQFASSEQITGNNGLSLKIENLNSTKTIAISNNQPYAQRVENGWSTQAPTGMMKITVAEYTDIIGTNAAKYRIK